MLFGNPHFIVVSSLLDEASSTATSIHRRGIPRLCIFLYFRKEPRVILNRIKNDYE
jgi:hypothetical protein